MKYLFIILTSLIVLSCALFNNNYKKEPCPVLSDSERDKMLLNELNKKRIIEDRETPPNYKDNPDYRDYCDIKTFPHEYLCYLFDTKVDEIDSVYVNHIISYFCKIILDDYEEFGKWHHPNLKFGCDYLSLFEKIGGDTQGEVFISLSVYGYAIYDQKKYGYSNTTDSLLREVDRKCNDSKFFKD